MPSTVINRKPIFDALRKILDRSITSTEVQLMDQACDLAEHQPPQHPLGELSAQFESGGRGAATVSGGANDPGGVSYGTYQLASKTGTAALFMAHEGAQWAAEFGTAKPGSTKFSAKWKAIAARDATAFSAAQHGFIERSHYRPAVNAVLRTHGLDLDSRHSAIRDAVWSVGVQHGKAAQILAEAVTQADAAHPRSSPAYDAALLEAIYAARSAYVLRVAARPSISAGERRTLQSLTRNRYPAELKAARAMLGKG